LFTDPASRRELLIGYVQRESFGENGGDKISENGVKDVHLRNIGEYPVSEAVPFKSFDAKMSKKTGFEENGGGDYLRTHGNFLGVFTSQNLLADSRENIKSNIGGNGDRRKTTRRKPNIFRFAELLQFTREFVRSLLASNAIARRDYTTAVRHGRDICAMSIETIESSSLVYGIAYELVHALAHVDEQDYAQDLPKEIYALTQISLQTACGATIQKYLNLSRGARLVAQAYSLCHDMAMAVSTEKHAIPFKSVFEDHFIEGVLVLEAKEIIPVLYKFAVLCTAIFDAGRRPIFCVSECRGYEQAHACRDAISNTDGVTPTASLDSAVTEIDEYLQRNLHLQLALAYHAERIAVINQYDSIRMIGQLVEKHVQSVTAAFSEIFTNTSVAALTNTSVAARREEVLSSVKKGSVVGAVQQIKSEAETPKNESSVDGVGSISVGDAVHRRTEMSATVNEILTQVLTKVISRAPVDCRLAVAYVTAMSSSEEVVKLMRTQLSIGHNYKRLLAAGQVRTS